MSFINSRMFFVTMDLRIVLLAVTVFLPALTAALGPTYFISAPNVIRVGVDESIVINIFGTVNAGASGVPVTVEIQQYPAGKTYCTTTVNVKKNEPKTITLRVPPDAVVAPSNPNDPQYVYLRAHSPSAAIQFDERTQVLLSYKAGFTFIQTDKPLYTPNQEVYIRLISLNQQMRPSQGKVRIDVITPHDVIVKRFDDLEVNDGFASVFYKFPVLPAFGNWTVAAYYGHQLKHNTTVQFLVKEYVLPTYSVEMMVEAGMIVEAGDVQNKQNGVQYILSSYEQITTLVSGVYVFGERVQGFFRIKYSLLDADGTLELIKDGINGSLNIHGEFTHKLMMSDILGDNDFDTVIGKRLHVEAFIIEGATGKIESRNHTVLQFVDSPYEFNWDQTLKYFKTNLPFEVKADVLFCYGDPVPNLEVSVSAIATMAIGPPRILESEEDRKTTNNQGQVGFTLNVQQGTQQIVITMTTVSGGELANFEYTETFTVEQFDAGGNNELLIRPGFQNVVKVSQNIPVDLQRSAGNQENVDVIFTYIVAGGKIIQPRAIQEVIANTVTDIQITQDMVPSARMVAFYVNENNQVVADSVWIDVVDKCENNVTVEVPKPTTGRTYFMPGDPVALTIRGARQTKVALLAVDKAVYLLQDYHRLNKKKIFARMASYDLGCGPGGGSDTEDIFKNAGITILTNAGLQTQHRQDLSCSEHNRRRRSLQDNKNYDINDLRLEYRGNATLMHYCDNGYNRTFANRNCQNRKDRLVRQNRDQGWDNDHPYAVALYECCQARYQETNQAQGRTVGGVQAEVPEIDLNEVAIRTMFPESWLFKDNLVDLGDNVQVNHPIPLPDSITTWILQAVGISPLHGMCVADDQKIEVRREFFLDVAVPYSVMRHEQVAIQATVHLYNDNRDINGNPQPLQVRVGMAGVDGLCSNAKPGDLYEQLGSVEPKKATTFTFIVVPLEVQDFIVTIYVSSTLGPDAVSKKLHVVSEGTRQVQPLSIVLDPAGIGRLPPNVEQPVDHGLLNNLDHMQLNDAADSSQIDTVKLTMPDDAIPNTAKCEVSVIGSLLGPVASADLDLEGDAFLNIPRGCGEQTLIYTAPNVYIYKYLKALQQDTPATEKKAIDYMEQGYSREINNYRTNAGAFKTFANTPGNSWLTALALKIFCQASEFIEVDEKGVICKAISWLESIQKQDGSFGFTADTRHGSHFMGGIDEDEPIPLTAFILIALSECKCSELNTTLTKIKATHFLEGKLPDIGQDAHTLAIVTYALALVDSARKDDANTQLKALSIDDAAQGTKHFGAQAGGAVTVETTAYALLAQIHLAQVSYSFPIVQWLMQQRNQIGNWYSTQDTMVSLQALSEYAARAHTGDINMHCDVTSTVDATFEPSWDIKPENALVLQATQAPVEGELLFQSKGTGIASLSVNLHYHKASGDGSNCPYFDIVIPLPSDDVEKVKAGAAPGAKQKKKIKLQVCAKYTGEGTTNMAIIDVGLLSGFVPVTESLKKVTEGSDVIQFFEVTDRNVVFYADSIPKGDDTVEPLCVEFEAVQDVEVGNVQPVPVKVYDYYLPERKCTKFYRPGGGSPLLEKICDGDVCTCAAASCLNMDPEAQQQAPILKNLACETVKHFAYKTSFVLKELKDTFEVFHMTVTPLKRGSDQDVQNSQQRQFWKSTNCEHPKIEDGNEYLIVGKGGLPVKDQNNMITSYKHFIDSDFTVIHWPRNDQFREEETVCKNACPVDANNNKCKVKCRRIHRPVENERRDFFQKVEDEFLKGCPL